MSRTGAVAQLRQDVAFPLCAIAGWRYITHVTNA